MLRIKRQDCISNMAIYSTEPLVHYVRKHRLGFLGHILRLTEKEPARRCTTSWQKVAVSSTHLLHHVHPMGVRKSWSWYISRADSHTCRRSMCMEKSWNRLFRGRKGWWWWWWWCIGEGKRVNATVVSSLCTNESRVRFPVQAIVCAFGFQSIFASAGFTVHWFSSCI